jgi:hypothetical protein
MDRLKDKLIELKPDEDKYDCLSISKFSRYDLIGLWRKILAAGNGSSPVLNASFLSTIPGKQLSRKAFVGNIERSIVAGL